MCGKRRGLLGCCNIRTDSSNMIIPPDHTVVIPSFSIFIQSFAHLYPSAYQYTERLRVP